MTDRPQHGSPSRRPGGAVLVALVAALATVVGTSAATASSVSTTSRQQPDMQAEAPPEIGAIGPEVLGGLARSGELGPDAGSFVTVTTINQKGVSQ